MPLLKINADGCRPALHEPGDLDAALAHAIGNLPPAAPVMILIHGYRFSPDRTIADPHRHILSLAPRAGCRKAKSWPRNLGFGRGAADEGLCIAFGWQARGTIWRAWRAGGEAGVALADLIGRIGALRAAPVDILCHSLGARVALTAVPHAPVGSVGRVVLMAAAEYRGSALRALQAPAGGTAEFINVTSRENDPFDAMVEWLIRARAARDRALGTGLGIRFSNWLDIRVDCPNTIEVLRDLGYRIPDTSQRICHWSAYLRPGLFSLYRDLIRDRDLLPLDRLACLLPDRPAPRWSRLLRMPQLRPWTGKAAHRSLSDLLSSGHETGQNARLAARLLIRFPAFRSHIW